MSKESCLIQIFWHMLRYNLILPNEMEQNYPHIFPMDLATFVSPQHQDANKGK